MYLQTCRLHLNIYVCVLNTIASIDDFVGFVYIIRCSSTGETCFIHLFIRWLGVWCIIIRKVMSSNLDPYTIWRWIRHLLSALSNPSAESQSILELNWTLYLFNLFLTSYTYIISLFYRLTLVSACKLIFCTHVNPSFYIDKGKKGESIWKAGHKYDKTDSVLRREESQ